MALQDLRPIDPQRGLQTKSPAGLSDPCCKPLQCILTIPTTNNTLHTINHKNHQYANNGYKHGSDRPDGESRRAEEPCSAVKVMKALVCELLTLFTCLLTYHK